MSVDDNVNLEFHLTHYNKLKTVDETLTIPKVETTRTPDNQLKFKLLNNLRDQHSTVSVVKVLR